VEPELVPGMVVMSEDQSDDRQWHYLPEYEEDRVPFATPGHWFSRDELPEHIRPVFGPREATS
jgi:hypothetical protein